MAAETWRRLYPFDSHELSLNGLRYHYLDEGRGETLLAVHGNPAWSFHWRDLVMALRTDHRLVVPDHMGCGLSDKPADYEYRLASHIKNLCTLIETLDLNDITLLVQDWGGAIGLGAAVEMPERFSRLVIFNTAAFRAPRMPWRIRVCRTPLLGRLAVQGLNGFARAALRMAVAKRVRMTAAVRAGILAPYGSWAERIAIHQFVADIPMHPSHPSYPALARIEARLPELADKPCLLIWGMRDWCFTPWFLERFLDFLPRAEVHRLVDAGHWVVEDAHERIVPLLQEFLASHPLADAAQAVAEQSADNG